jgi:hypothetical protein
MPAPARVIRAAAEVTAEWLAGALGRTGLEVRSTEPIGTGQMSQSHRVTFAERGGDAERGGAAETVVVKLASADATSRATGMGMGAYYREVAFYRNLAARIGGPVPDCYCAAYDPGEGWFTLVLEDVAGAEQGDQIAGCSVDEARIALRALARVHVPVLGDPVLGSADWLNQPNPLTEALLGRLLPGFLERYGERVNPAHAAVCERFVPSIDAWASDRRPPLGLVHGDYRLDNLLFRDGTCKVVDWQTVSWGPVMIDVAYFIGGGLPVADRRAHEEALVRLYHDTLLELGVEGFGWERCWDEYRRATFHGILMTVAASMIVARTDRGDDMFMAWLERNAQQVLDLDAFALLPEPGAARPAPPQPAPADEGRHTPGPESLWNESWYFDAVGEDADLGVYARLGRLPNQDACLYAACICGPGRPSIMLVDGSAPLPPPDDDAQVVDTAGLHAEHHCEEALRRFRVTLAGTARAHTDASAPLRGERGEPVEIALDLVWETDGVPYAWRQASRYEIPCRVSGAVRIGDEEVAFAGPGQRDHSWGARDWWAVDWMWSALHLGDGTHVHAVAVPQVPGYGVGYVQDRGRLTEIESVRASEEVAADGLITSATIACDPDALSIDVEPVAFGAILLEAPDGRVSHFPRAMCRVRTADGRVGGGWMEWNRIQRG